MTSTDDDSIGDGLGGSYSIDEDNQQQSEQTLVDRGVDDVLDEGFSPPDRPVAVTRFGTTAQEAEEGESLDQRLAEEEPDPTLQLEDDHDDLHEDSQVGGERAGRLVAPDEGAHEDTEKDLVARDVGISGAGAGAEEAAVHVLEDDENP